MAIPSKIVTEHGTIDIQYALQNILYWLEEADINHFGGMSSGLLNAIADAEMLLAIITEEETAK